MSAPNSRWLAARLRVAARPVRCGPLMLALVSSLLYFRWRNTDPQRAHWINRHAWIAAGLNMATNIGLLLVAAR